MTTQLGDKKPECVLVGLFRIRQGKQTKTAAGQATDLIRAKPINANDTSFDVRAAA